MALTAYADVDHAGCQDTRRSTPGSAQFLGDKLVSWSSKKKKTTTISTTEAEYIAMSRCYNMANENVLAPSPTRSDDQILPFAAWVPIGRATLSWIFKRSKRTQSFRSLWIFCKTKTSSKRSLPQLMSQLSTFNTLEIIPIDQAHPFVSPPSGDAIMDFVNELGYTEEIHFVSRMATFLMDKANLSIAPQKGKKTKPHVVPYCWFTKLIICHLGRTHNIHQRSASSFYLAEEDHRLRNLKFVPKGEEDEHDQKIAAEKGGKKKHATAKQLKPKHVKEKSSKPAPAPKPKVTQEKPSKPSPAKHPKRGEKYDVERAIQMSLESFQVQGQAHVGGVAIREPVAEATGPLPVVKGKGKAIATEEQATQSPLDLHTPKRRSTTDQFIFQNQTPATEEASTGTFAQPQDDTFANIVCDTPSHADAKIGVDTDKINSGGDTEILQIGEEQGEDVANMVDLEEKTAKINEGQAGSEPGKTPESRPPPERVLVKEDQAVADVTSV
ncbi:integrase, catalytic region, zinc finger, CCHC-type containing protein, partial [Tanacetum coccineum]